MIFPERFKGIGVGIEKPLGDLIYFLSDYIIVPQETGAEIYAVEGGTRKGIFKEGCSLRLLAGAGETTYFPEPVNQHNRADLILKAASTGKRCTIFTGHDEHQTFVIDPDPSVLTTIHVYDITPPRPHLAATVQELTQTAIFGEYEVLFEYHVRDITTIDADIFPCRAAGFTRTLDEDPVTAGDTVAGCTTARQVVRDGYHTEKSVTFHEICPVEAVMQEPFIARCCRSERTGYGKYRGFQGGVVHWGANPREVYEMARAVIAGAKKNPENRKEPEA